jgi:hypothetical protein
LLPKVSISFNKLVLKIGKNLADFLLCIGRTILKKTAVSRDVVKRTSCILWDVSQQTSREYLERHDAVEYYPTIWVALTLLHPTGKFPASEFCGWCI